MKNKCNGNIIAGLLIISLLFLVMLISFFYTPYDVNNMDISNKFLKPSFLHLLGTDNFGRDILSRVMAGTRVTFLIGTIVVAIGAVIGTIIGAVAGYLGGWVDEIFMRIIDALMAFPSIVLALLIITVFGTGKMNTIIALGITFIPSYARIARGGVMQYREAEFVNSAKAFGASNFRIIFVHILPNISQSLIVASSIGFANAVLSEAGLSYLGLGVQPPDPSWGRMIKEAQNYLFKAPWYAMSPGIAITLAVLGFNLLGDGIGKARNIRRG